MTCLHAVHVVCVCVCVCVYVSAQSSDCVGVSGCTVSVYICI